MTPTTRKKDCDVLIAGATPAGVMAAVSAARRGVSVVLVEYHHHIGGMTASGLGKSDVENRAVIGGLFREFTGRVHRYYSQTYGEGSENVVLCREGYYYEPSVAEKVMWDMLREAGKVVVHTGYRIREVRTGSQPRTTVVFEHRTSGDEVPVTARIVIDATYEGDCYAMAGVPYRTGRESRDAFGEAHAGRIFFDHEDHRILPGSTGEGDDRLPAFTYRLCLTDDPANSFVLDAPPEGYDRDIYRPYLVDLRAGRLSGPKEYVEGHGYYREHFDTMLRVFSFAKIPNRKYDVNINPRPMAFPFPEENRGYEEAGPTRREEIARRHRQLVLGLLYFIQNDPEVPEAQREMARRYHLPLDEFVDNEHFPWQLYVRECRRLEGQYTLTENEFATPDASVRSSIFHDSIMAGEFPIDSFPVTRERSIDDRVLEGYICMLGIAPYQIPARIMLTDQDPDLIVPVAASTTHVAFSTIRMEPVWMGLGQAAGQMAALALLQDLSPAEIDVALLQRNLLEEGQVITYFRDVDPADKAYIAAQFWGARGFFAGYEARLHEPITTRQMEDWLRKTLTEAAVDAEFVFGRGRDSGASVYADQLLRWCDVDSQSVRSGARSALASIFSGADWRYDDRAPDQPVLRGEACMALYIGFFRMMEKDHHIV